MKTGIYAIVHRASGKQYIGSAINFAKRFTQHRYFLNKGEHHNEHLQRA